MSHVEVEKGIASHGKPISQLYRNSQCFLPCDTGECTPTST